MEGGAKVRHKVAALLEVLSHLASNGVHNEIRHLKRRLAVLLAHKVTLDRDRRAALFKSETLKRLLDQTVGPLRRLEDNGKRLESRPARDIDDPRLKDLGDRRHRPDPVRAYRIGRDDGAETCERMHA